MNEMQVDVESLPRYRYPYWIYVFLGVMVLIFLSTVPSFFLYDLDHCREVGKTLKEADSLYLNKRYYEAFVLYSIILKEYPNSKEIKIKIAQIYFIKSSQKEVWYKSGLVYLQDLSLTQEEISHLKSFLPSQYHENFDSLWGLI